MFVAVFFCKKEGNMKLQENVKILHYDNKVIYANSNNGTWVRTSNEVAMIIDLLLKSKINSIEEEVEFDSEEDKEYFTHVVNDLKACNILVEDNNIFPDSPNLIIFETTNRCNLRCTHCSAAAGEDNEKELDTAEVKKILDRCIEWNPELIALSGGEHLFRKDFFEILQYLRERFHKNIGLNTNGLLINQQNVHKICESVQQIDISIDGVNEETCSIYRGKGVFEKVMKTIDLLHDTGFNNISLSMVFTDKNEHLKDEFTELNRRLGTHPVYRLLSAKGRAETNKDILTNVAEEECYIPKSFIEDGSEEGTGVSTCQAGIKSIMIRYNGDVYPCPSYSPYEDYLMGNVRNVNSICELTGQNMLKSVQDNMYRTNRMYHGGCVECPVKLFCFSCPGGPYSYASDKVFEEYCKVSKAVLMKRVWGV